MIPVKAPHPWTRITRGHGHIVGSRGGSPCCPDTIASFSIQTRQLQSSSHVPHRYQAYHGGIGSRHHATHGGIPTTPHSSKRADDDGRPPLPSARHPSQWGPASRPTPCTGSSTESRPKPRGLEPHGKTDAYLPAHRTTRGCPPLSHQAVGARRPLAGSGYRWPGAAVTLPATTASGQGPSPHCRTTHGHRAGA